MARLPQRLSIVVGLLTAVLATAVPAFAQFAPPRPRQERPERGLFGSGLSNTEQRLVLNVSFGGGYDNDPFGTASGGSPVPGGVVAPRGVGQYGYGSAGLDYRVARKTVQGSANVSGTGQYYPDLQDPSIFSYGAGAQVSWQPARRTTVSTSHQFTAQPTTLRLFFGLPVGANTPPDSTDTLDYAISRRTYKDWRSSVDLMQGITERLSGSAGYTYYNVDGNSPGYGSYAAQTISGRLTYQISKSLSAYGGYNYTATDYADSLQQNEYGGRSIDAGVNFGKPLSLTRRTSLSFAGGVSGVNYSGETSYYATGHVRLDHELARSWTLYGEARRSVNFYQVFAEPVVSDSVSGGVSGLLSQRIQFGANAGWSSGFVGVTSANSDFDSWVAGASMRVALWRNAGLAAHYSIFKYVFEDRELGLPGGVRPQMSNQSIRVTFDWMLPLVTVRRANASR